MTWGIVCWQQKNVLYLSMVVRAPSFTCVVSCAVWQSSPHKIAIFCSSNNQNAVYVFAHRRNVSLKFTCWLWVLRALVASSPKKATFSCSMCGRSETTTRTPHTHVMRIAKLTFYCFLQLFFMKLSEIAFLISFAVAFMFRLRYTWKFQKHLWLAGEW